MKNKKNISILIFLLSTSHLFSGGLELRILVSSKLFVGIGYRHYIDPNTSLRLGVSSSITGIPLGLSAHIFQDFSPQEKWTPLFGLGIDTFFYLKNKTVHSRYMPSASGGFAYRPNPFITHQVEANILHLPQTGRNKPFGLGYSVINCSMQ